MGDAKVEKIRISSTIGIKRQFGHQTDIHVQTLGELKPSLFQERPLGWILSGQICPDSLSQGGVVQVLHQGQLCDWRSLQGNGPEYSGESRKIKFVQLIQVNN